MELISGAGNVWLGVSLAPCSALPAAEPAPPGGFGGAAPCPAQ